MLIFKAFIYIFCLISFTFSFIFVDDFEMNKKNKICLLKIATEFEENGFISKKLKEQCKDSKSFFEPIKNADSSLVLNNDKAIQAMLRTVFDKIGSMLLEYFPALRSLKGIAQYIFKLIRGYFKK
jgi:hypothetical protein